MGGQRFRFGFEGFVTTFTGGDAGHSDTRDKSAPVISASVGNGSE